LPLATKQVAGILVVFRERCSFLRKNVRGRFSQIPAGAGRV